MLGRDKKSSSIGTTALGMKTILHIANTSISVTKSLEVVPNIEDWLVIYETVNTTDKIRIMQEGLPYYSDYDSYCKHKVKSRDWHLYDDHTEASILLSACSRRDKCILVPSD